ncbi:MAG TPA: ABC transporter permease [Beijerinckiaceae bacterium]|nr:ABC transporter permease [Beijerinckiaceae bacterium]
MISKLSYSGRVKAARWGILLAFLVFFEVYGRFFADPAFLQPPSAIVAALFDKIFANPQAVSAVLTAVFEIGTAYALAIVVGVFLGVVIGATDFARESFFPIVLLLYAIPQVTLMPLVILVFGLGPPAKIAFGFSHGVFPVIVNVVAGMRGVNELYLRSARSMGASRADILRHVILPHIVPSLFTGLRLAMTLTLLGVILAELYVSTAGIGYFARLFAENYSPAPLFALIGTLAAIALCFNFVVRLAERALTPGKRRAATVPVSGVKAI